MLRDDIGHRECFAGAGYAHQRLELFAGAQSIREPLDCLRLVPGRVKLVV